MAGVNKVILIGNLGADPEIKHLQNDVTVANFNIATTEYFKDKQTGERARQRRSVHRLRPDQRRLRQTPQGDGR